jgi:uncharacterized repeat protein (TIGR01451 family)
VSRRLPGRALALVVLIGLGGLAGLSVPERAAAAYGEHAYPSNPILGPNGTFQSVYAGQTVAQSFQVAQTTVLLNLSLYLANLGGGSNTITATIRTDNPTNHTPTSTILGTSRLVVPVGPPANYTMAFNPGAVLQGGRLYWIVASNPAGTSSQGYRWYDSGGNTYPSGWAEIFNVSTAAWATLVTDLFFQLSGRSFDATLGLGLSASAAVAQPSDIVTFTISLNNTGNESADIAWVNATVPAALTYVSDTASAMVPPSITGYPNFTFRGIGNGPHSFAIRVQVNVTTPPGSFLTTVVRMRFTNNTGILQPAVQAQATLAVGIVSKALYLAPNGTLPRLLRTPAPTTTAASFVNITRPNSADFVLVQRLSQPFLARNLTLFLFVDSQTGKAQTLVLDLTLFDKNGSTTSTVSYVQWTFLTDGTRGFQAVSINFGVVNHTFPVGHQIQLRVLADPAGTDGLFTVFNSTVYPARLVMATTTYVSPRVVLQDSQGRSTTWSPFDSLVILANVTDPFGARAIAGARVNVTAPGGSLVVAWALMTLTATDPSNPPVWERFQYAVSPPLANGTYRVDVIGIEDNGVQRMIEASALVRSPSVMPVDKASVLRAKAGDSFSYTLWFNNSGSGPASTAWLNDTMPSQLTFLGASIAPTSVSGNLYSWTFSNLGPGNHSLQIDVQLPGTATQVAWIRNAASIRYTDEKGYLWPAASAFADVVINGPILTLAVSTVPALKVHVNETVSYVVNVTNSGDPAPSIWVNDTLPTGFAYVSDTAGTLGGKTTVVGDQVDILLNGMPAGTPTPITWSFTIILRAPAVLARNATIMNGLSVVYSGVGGALMPPIAAGPALTAAAPWVAAASFRFLQSTASFGEGVRAQVSFSNIGNEPASVADLSLVVPSDLSLVNASATVLSSVSPIQIRLSAVGIGPHTVDLNFSVSLTAADGQNLTVNGGLSYDDAIGNPEPAVLVAGAVLRISSPMMHLAVSPTSTDVEVASNLTLAIDLSNTGSGIADDLWLNLSLPAPFAFQGASFPSPPTVSGSLLTWHLQDQWSGSRWANLTFLARSSAANGTRANLTFRLDYTTDAGIVLTASPATAAVTIVAPYLNVNLTADRSQVVAGNPFTYAVRIKNLGGSVAHLVTVVDTLDPNLAVVSYDSAAPAMGSGTLTWTFRDLGAGASIWINLTVRVAGGLSPNTLIANVVDVTYTNSAGTVVGYAHQPLTVTVAADLLPLLWIFLGGLLAGGVALLLVTRRRNMQIEDAFLVYHDGVLISHLSRSIMKDKDEDVLSGMLTAVQEFVRDAFRYGEHRELHHMDFGDYRILIEQGRLVYLAVVYRGGDSAGMRKRVRSVIDRIESAYGKALENWNGELEHVIGVRDMMRDSLLGTNGHAAKTRAGIE